MLDPDTWRMIDWPAEQRPMLVVVVDTEAEFDWKARGPRRAMGVSSVKCQDRAQAIFARYRVKPTFVLDYPVSSTTESSAFIRELYRAGACEIGAHLQPWDNPPLVEPVTDHNSYPGNLPCGLEREKLARLTRAIEQNIGVHPRIYKAGRYGSGARRRASSPSSATRSMSALCRGLISPANSAPIFHIAAPAPTGLELIRRFSKSLFPLVTRDCSPIPGTSLTR
jgi:hypothetical protein